MGALRNRVGKAFGDVLKDARIKKKLTQEQLAEISEYEASYISLLESGGRQPTITAIMAFEQALGLDPGELVRRTAAAMRGKRIIRATGKATA